MLHHHHLALADLHWNLELEPKNSEVRYLLGQIRSAMGESGLAAKNYREALVLNPDLVGPKLALESLEAEAGGEPASDDSKSKPSQTPAARSGSGNLTSTDTRGFHARRYLPSVAELTRVQADETLVGAIERALHAIPDDGSEDNLLKKAVLLSALHRREAGPTWERLFGMSGIEGDLISAIRVYYEHGEWDEIVRLTPRDNRPSDQEFLRMYAHALLSAGRAKDAVEVLVSVPEPTVPTLQVLTGVYLALGDSKAADRLCARMREITTADPRVLAVQAIADRTWFSAHRPLDDLVGLESVKTQLRERVVLPLLAPEMFLSGSPSNKFLMMGPPGCGKTLMAKVAAKEAQSSFRVLHLSSVLNLYTGNSEANLTATFMAAKAATSDAPVILFIDEVDSIVVSRDRMMQAGEHRLINHFMDELDQIRYFPKLIVLAATNMPVELDSAVVRSGRLGTPIYVGPPGVEARTHLIERELGRIPHSEIDADRLAVNLQWYSPADIEQTFSNLRYTQKTRFLKGDRTLIDQPEIEGAFRSVTPSVRRWFQRLAERLAEDPSVAGMITPDLQKDLEGFLAQARKTPEKKSKESSMFG